MVAVDTNVIVRLLTRDEEKQFQKAAWELPINSEMKWLIALPSW